MLAPSRERSLAGLRNDQFQKGRLGLSVGATGERPSGGLGLSATNPELEAYYNSLAQEDLALAARAEEAGRQRTAFGTGLFSTGNQLLDQYYGGQVSALNPFTTYLGAGQTLEELGQAPLKLGAALGGQAAAYGGNVGQALLTGGMSAAKIQQGGQGFSPMAGFYQGLANSPRLQTGFENLFGNYTMNRNIEGALPQSANPYGNPMSAEQMDRMSYGYY